MKRLLKYLAQTKYTPSRVHFTYPLKKLAYTNFILYYIIYKKAVPLLFSFLLLQPKRNRNETETKHTHHPAAISQSNKINDLQTGGLHSFWISVYYKP